MEQLEQGRSEEGKQILIVENDPSFANVVGRTLNLPFSSFIITQNDSITDILNKLLKQYNKANAILINAQLSFQGSSGNYGGIELYKHIRLSLNIGALSLSPVIIISLDDPAHFIRQSVDNVILFAPGCKVIKLPAKLEDLRSAVTHDESFLDENQLHNNLATFVVFTENDERARSHSYLNKAGAPKFLREFAGHTMPSDNPALQQSDNIDLWMKKMNFLNPSLRADGVVSKEETEKLRSVCHGHRFIYIDDEHRNGWSYGLYTGLSGKTIDCSYFNRQDHSIESPDSLLSCIDCFDEAEAFFKGKENQLNDLIENWAAAEEKEWIYRLNLNEAKKNLNNTVKKLEECSKREQKACETYESLEKLYTEQSGNARKALESCTEKIIETLDPDHAHEHVKQLHGIVSEYVETKSRRMNVEAEKNNAQTALNDIKKQYECFQQELINQEKQYKSAQKELKDAEDAVNRLFPYSLIFLDLRLSGSREENLPIEEVSGIRLLSSIKRFFPYIRVIVMTSSQKAISSEKVREMGGDGYWIKGVSTGMGLYNNILECLDNQDIRKMWVDVRKLEKKKEIYCIELKNGRIEEYALDNFERNLVVQWLLESIYLLQTKHRKVFNGGSDYLNHVILNMALVQELRLKDIKDKTWEDMRRSNRLQKEDQDLRFIRNKVLAHASRKNIEHTKDEAIRFIRFTINQLLMRKPEYLT